MFEGVREQIASNLQVLGDEEPEIEIYRDGYGRVHVRVVSDPLAFMGPAARVDTVTAGVSIGVDRIVVLTRAEAADADEIADRAGPSEAPSWPEALARAGDTRVGPTPLVSSDIDAGLPRPAVVTFYSLRGGVGRTTALAHSAIEMALRGKRVVVVDMDLEAPGLDAMLGIEREVRRRTGSVFVLQQMDAGEKVDVLDHIVRVSEELELYCLPAGIPDAEYARTLRLLDPEAWYFEDENPLHALVDCIAATAINPDVIIFDSRTGISPISAPLLFDVSDLAVVAFYPHEQARLGTENIVGALSVASNRRSTPDRQVAPDVRFLVSPVPAASEARTRILRRAEGWVSSWLGEFSPERLERGALTSSDVMQAVGYSEAIASGDDIFSIEHQPYFGVTEWITGLIADQTGSGSDTLSSPGNTKAAVLADLEFSGGTAEGQNAEDFLDGFVTTDVVRRAMDPGVPLVIGRKGVGKTAVFRRLLHPDGEEFGLPITAPADLRAGRRWIAGPDAFAAIDAVLQPREAGWREAWTIMVAAILEDAGVRVDLGLDATAPRLVLNGGDATEEAIVEAVATSLETSGGAFTAWQVIADADRKSIRRAFLLFDGLDSGFGHTGSERQRRGQAIDGLIAFLLDRLSSLERLRPKILLREDLWRKASVPNKSHMYGRSVSLAWREQQDYLKPVLKQALRSNRFKDLVTANRLPVDPEFWDADAVFAVWALLVGERMKGGQTTFTRNWVWNRLADGNEDRAPRALIQLFREAASWEADEDVRNPFERTLIRPRALIESFTTVSREALEGLREEYPEIETVIDRLRQLARSPVDAEDLSEIESGELEFAREVGLLEVYEADEARVRRYRVPDLYRLGLDMTRMGQA